MAEKFDLIAKVEEGANPILLGIAAPAEAPEEDAEEDEGATPQVRTLEAPAEGWGQSAAVRAAAEAVARSSRGMGMVEAGTIDRDSEAFRSAMDRGFEAGRHLHAGACGAHEGADPEAMQYVKKLTPPQRSFAQSVARTSTVSPHISGPRARHGRRGSCWNSKPPWKQRSSNSPPITRTAWRLHRQGSRRRHGRSAGGN